MHAPSRTSLEERRRFARVKQRGVVYVSDLSGHCYSAPLRDIGLGGLALHSPMRTTATWSLDLLICFHGGPLLEARGRLLRQIPGHSVVYLFESLSPDSDRRILSWLGMPQLEPGDALFS